MSLLPKKNLFLFCFVFGVLLSLPLFLTKAQELNCNTVAECTALLNEYENRIANLEKNLSATRKERRSLQNKVAWLKKRIAQIEKEIKDKERILEELVVQIGETEKSILDTQKKIERDKQKLRSLLIELYLVQKRGSLESLVAEGSVSGYFERKAQLEILIEKNRRILAELKELKSILQEQQNKLEAERRETEDTAKVLALQKGEIQSSTQKISSQLSVVLQKEKSVAQTLEEERKKAQKIRQRLFQLIGVPKAPTFKEALELARFAESVTGVRPAFLLGVLTQESNIGRNVGQCYLTNPKTGEGVVAKTGKRRSRVMHPRRDVPYFLEITRKVGRDPYKTLVSCPMSFGWGGAMGPAQFIPSTWVRYQDRVSQVTGQPADPWNIRDAFLAAAFLLRDAGASKRTFNAEWRAALIYFAGRVNLRYRFYADSVMRIVRGYEKDIELLERVR